jgi:hypothetical protein
MRDSHELTRAHTIPGRTISIRLPSQLATDLRRAAEREANRDCVVARRLIAAGLQREVHADPDTDPRKA